MKFLLRFMAGSTFQLFLLGSVYVLSILIAPQDAQSSRDIPDNNLGYPVLIVTDKNKTGSVSKGSGFYLNAHNSIFLVTARHVLFDEKSGNKLFDTSITCSSYSPDPLDNAVTSLAININTLDSSGNLKRHLTEDVLLLKIGSLSENKVHFLEGVEAKALSEKGIVSAPLQQLKPFNQVLVGNEVFVFGYPVSIGLTQSPQFDYNKPLLRKGIIAGKNDKAGTLILDLPVYKGNSGGPVLEVETEGPQKKFRIVGVVVERVPAVLAGEDIGILTNSGYSVAASMNPVLELLSIFSAPLQMP